MKTITRTSFATTLFAWCGLAVSAAFGADISWTGNAGDGAWNTSGNWSPTQVPGSSDKALFSSKNVTVNLGEGANIFGFYNDGGAVTIANGVLKTNGDKIETKNSDLVFSDVTIQSTGTGAYSTHCIRPYSDNRTITFKGECALEGTLLRTSNKGCVFAFKDGATTSDSGFNFGSTAYTFTLKADNATFSADSLVATDENNKSAWNPVFIIKLGENNKPGQAIFNFSGDFTVKSEAKTTISVDVGDKTYGSYPLIMAGTFGPTLDAMTITVKRGDETLIQGEDEDYTLALENGILSLKLNGEEPAETVAASAENTRLWGFCGVPEGDSDGDDEFIILTNYTHNVVSLDGVEINIVKKPKTSDPGWEGAKCIVVLSSETIEPYGWIRLNHGDYGWEKITNGEVLIRLRANDEETIIQQFGRWDGTESKWKGEVKQDDIGVGGTGFFAVYNYDSWTEDTDHGDDEYPAKHWGTMRIDQAPGAPEHEPSLPEEFVLTGDLNPVEEGLTIEPREINLYSRTNVTVTFDAALGTNVMIRLHSLKKEGSDKPNVVNFTIYSAAATTNTLYLDDFDYDTPIVSAVGANLIFDGQGRNEFILRKSVKGHGVVECENATVVGGDTFIQYKNASSSEPETACLNLYGNYLQTGGEFKVSMPKWDWSNEAAAPEYLCVNEFWGVRLFNKNTSFTLEGGDFKAKIGGAKSSAVLLKGSCTATIKGGEIDAEIVGSNARVISGGTINFEGGDIKVKELVEESKIKDDGDEVIATVTNNTTHARVFKSDKNTTISGGKFNITVPSAESEIFNPSDSITINGGTFELEAGDDCVSADTNVTITAGNFYGHSLGGDVIDANNNLTISGGLVLAYTQAINAEGQAEKGLDVNVGGQMDLTGDATILALGAPGASFEGDITGNRITERITDASAFSEKYIQLFGDKLTVIKLPVVADESCYLAVAPGLNKVSTTDVQPAEGGIGFHEVYILDNPEPPVIDDPTEESIEKAKHGGKISIPPGSSFEINGNTLTIADKVYTAKPGYIFAEAEGVVMIIDPEEPKFADEGLALKDENVNVTIQTLSGFKYELRYSTTLDNFDQVDATVVGDGQVHTLEGQKHGDKCFYRISISETNN